jgi:hypothetical protein
MERRVSRNLSRAECLFVDHFDHWMIILESLKALQGYDTITIGHDTPVHRSAIDSTITYVNRAKEIHAASADAKTYSESLKAAFPDRRQAGWVDFLREPSLRRAPLNAASRRHRHKGRTDKKEPRREGDEEIPMTAVAKSDSRSTTM